MDDTSWVCINCETLNTEGDRCFMCDASRATATERECDTEPMATQQDPRENAKHDAWTADETAFRRFEEQQPQEGKMSSGEKFVITFAVIILVVILLIAFTR